MWDIKIEKKGKQMKPEKQKGNRIEAFRTVGDASLFDVPGMSESGHQLWRPKNPPPMIHDDPRPIPLPRPAELCSLQSRLARLAQKRVSLFPPKSMSQTSLKSKLQPMVPPAIDVTIHQAPSAADLAKCNKSKTFLQFLAIRHGHQEKRYSMFRICTSRSFKPPCRPFSSPSSLASLPHSTRFAVPHHGYPASLRCTDSAQ